MGYYANAALERSYQERSCCGYPSREETLTYYLEDLQARLSTHCDAARYTGVKGRYRYYEVPWAAAPCEGTSVPPLRRWRRCCTVRRTGMAAQLGSCRISCGQGTP